MAKYKATESRSALRNMVSEPEAASIVNGFDNVYGKPRVKLRVIKNGLSPVALQDFIKIFGGTKEDVANLLHISDKTLRTYINDSKSLDVGLSEHLIQLFELFDKGREVFGSLGEFKKWLSTYSQGIGDVPLDLLDFIIGIEFVMDELFRIEFGALA